MPLRPTFILCHTWNMNLGSWNLSAFSISLSGTLPPSILYTYSAVINSGSNEQDFPSFSMKSFSLLIISIPVTVKISPYLILYRNFFTHDGDTVIQNMPKANRFAEISYPRALFIFNLSPSICLARFHPFLRL